MSKRRKSQTFDPVAAGETNDSDNEEWEPLEQHHHRSSPATASIVDTTTSLSVVDTIAQQHDKRQITAEVTIPKNKVKPQQHHHGQSTKKNLQQELVHGPLQMLWTRFWIFFLKRVCQKYFVSLILIGFGSCLQVFLWWHVFVVSSWWSRVTVTTTVALVGMGWFMIMNNSGEQQQQLWTAVNLSRHGRFLMLFSFMVPTLLEMRAVHLLVALLTEHASVNIVIWTSASMVGIICVVYKSLDGSTTNQPTTTILHHKNPRTITYVMWAILYMVALLVALASSLKTHSCALLAPLLTCTGVAIMVVSNNNNNDDRLVQQALAQSLHQVLQTVGTCVKQDELLQLTIIRWIVDYWSTTTTTTTAQNSSQDESPITINDSTVPSSESQQPTNNSNPDHIDWSDLFPMLTVTVDQMQTEVTQQQQRPTETTNNSTVNTNDTMSLHNLKTMLASMDIDQQAQPAVEAYRQAVQSFPPDTRTAIFCAVLGRCPATLLLLLLLMTHTHYYFTNDLWSFVATFVLLVPLVVLEYQRINQWTDAIVSTAPAGEPTQGLFWRKLHHVNDPMLILLSNDDHINHPSSLLLVWRNIVDSVQALQVSLTTARCVHTTAVAVNFAQNILSLAQFGMEVSQYGWGHGLKLLVREWMELAQDHNDGGASAYYTRSAQDAVRNGAAMNRNIQTLWNENHGQYMIAPIVSLVPALIGYGWLWGGVGEANAVAGRQGSTVVIEELDDDNAPSSNSCSNNKEVTLRSDECHDGYINLSTSSCGVDLEGEEEEPKQTLPQAIPQSKQEKWSDINNSQTETKNQDVLQPQNITESLVTKNTVEASTDQKTVKQVMVSTGKLDSQRQEESLNEYFDTKESSSAAQTLHTSERKVSIDSVLEKKSPSEDEDLVADVLDLLAQCEEHGCLDQSDKANLLSQLPEQSQSSETGWLESTKNMLQGLLDHTTETAYASAEVMPFDMKSQGKVEQNNCTDEDEGFEPLDNGIWNSAVTEMIGQPIPLDNTEKNAGGNAGESEKNKDENLLMRVGGGIAILGAVVGGVALAAGTLAVDRKRDRRCSETERR